MTWASVWKLARSLSHEGVLERGYALALGADGHVLSRAASVAPGQALTLKFSDGEVAATADGGEDRPARKPAGRPRPSGTPQADLFG